MLLTKNSGIVWSLAIVTGIACAILFSKYISRKPKLARFNFSIIYTTISSTVEKDKLIGYELHNDGDNEMQCIYWAELCPKLNAIIKNIDPANDNYKSYCRDIITDVLNKLDNKYVLIDIYDDYVSYKLARKSDIFEAHESDSVSYHKIARYGYNCGNDKTYLTFYPDLEQSGLFEREVFTYNQIR